MATWINNDIVIFIESCSGRDTAHESCRQVARIFNQYMKEKNLYDFNITGNSVKFHHHQVADKLVMILFTP